MKRILLLLSIVLFSTLSNAQGIRGLMSSGSVKYTPPVVHNAYVQAVIDQATIDGATIPDETTLAGLDGFFNDVRVSVPLADGKAEMIKFGHLQCADCLEFSRYNFIDPSSYKSVFYNGNPIYGLRGWSSDGDSYIDDIITMKRRANLQLNSSSIVVTDSYVDTSVDQAACGSVSGNYYIIRPYYTGASSYYLSGLNNAGNIASLQNTFTGVTTSGASGTRARFLQNTTYKNLAADLTTEMTNDLPVYTCAYNNAGTAIRFYTVGNIQFRWEGYELTDAEMEGIRDAYADYVTAITPTFTAGDDITADGKEGFCVCADSKGGTSTAVGRYALPNTVFQRLRTGGTITEVKGADLADIPSTGSWMPYFGRLYNERAESKGKRIVFAHYAWGGSSFLNDFKPASWDQDDSGQLYPLFKTVCDGLLSTLGVTKPKAIIVILGINDMNESLDIADTQTEIDNLFNRLNTDYDSPQIYVSLPGLETPPGEPQLTRLNTIRAKISSIAAANSNIIIFEDEYTDVFDDPSNSDDGSHFNYAGNEVVAQNLIAGLVDPVYFSAVSTNQTGRTISVTFNTEVTNQNQPPSFEYVTVSGTETDGETLTATNYVFNSPGGYPEGTHTYQWHRADNQQSAGSTIGGATSSTYVLTQDDVAKYIRCVVTPVQSGGMNTTGTAVTSTYTGQIQDDEWNPFTDITTWFIAHRPSGYTTGVWVNEGTEGGANSVQNGSDAVPTATADGPDFELSNNEELVMDQPTPEYTKPVVIWMRIKLESYNGSWARLIDFNGTHLVEQRDDGAIYLSGGSCAYSAPLGEWIILRFVISSSANSGEFMVNGGTNKTDVASSTGAFGTSNGRLGANAAGTTSRADVLWSHLFIGPEETSEETTLMLAWFAANAPYDP